MSNDLGLGCPFNIASASLLTYMLAKMCDLKPGELVYNIGDAHIYLNHIPALKEQLKRVPRELPSLEIIRKARDPGEYTFEDLKLEGYKPYPSIKMQMAV